MNENNVVLLTNNQMSKTAFIDEAASFNRPGYVRYTCTD